MRQTDQPFDWRVCLMEPDEPRGSRPVLREAGGVIPVWSKNSNELKKRNLQLSFNPVKARL